MARSRIDNKKLIEIDAVNRKILSNPKKLIRKADGFYHAQLNDIARHTAADEDIRFIFVAGPSASGKTTSANLLRRKLAWFGIYAITVSLDNFFLDRDKIAPEKDGRLNLEKPEIIDIKLFNTCLHELISKRESSLPIYDFSLQARSAQTLDFKMRDKSVIIIEGIHALNPLLYDAEISERSVKVYVVPNSHFAREKEIVISANAIRLMRRMYRDMLTRGAGIEQTLNMWPSVNRGAELYIKPFKRTADFIVDTTHLYEPYLYKSVLLPLLYDAEPRVKAAHLIKPFELLPTQITEDDIPATSLINEFLGKESMFY